MSLIYKVSDTFTPPEKGLLTDHDYYDTSDMHCIPCREREIEFMGPNAVLGRLVLRCGEPGKGYDRHGPGRQRDDGAVQMSERDGEEAP